MYYNPTTQEFLLLRDVLASTGLSAEEGAERVGDWYLLHHGPEPEVSATQKVMQQGIGIIDGFYCYLYVAVDKTAEELLLEKKSSRYESVSALTVEVDGMIFDANEAAQTRIARAILARSDDSTEVEWVLADNTVASVTIAQLKRVLLSAVEQTGTEWVKPYK